MSDWIANECAKQGVSVPEKEGVDYRTFDVYSPQKLKEMQEIARSRGGRCLSPRYIHKETKMQWECGKGHTWWARAGGVKMGQWCPKCGSKKSADTRRSNIEEMQKVAEARGGKCLSSVYVNNLTKLEWICSKGHRWFATPINVKNSHHWCPYCSNRSPYRIRLTLVDMQKTAEERGGRCLSTKYVNNRIKLRWQCDKGHVWETKPANVRSGTWCPFCAGKRHS